MTTGLHDSKGEFLPAVRILLQGIAKHVVSRESREQSQDEVETQQLRMPSDEICTLPAVVATAETAVRLLREHSNRQVRHHNLRFAEQQAAIRLLMDVLEDLSIAGPETMRQLWEIDKRLEAAVDARSLRTAKTALALCLEQVRREAERRINTADGQSEVDSVTNLPGHGPAENALVEAGSSSEPMCVVVLLMHRLELYNRRYGKAVGDKALAFLASFIKGAFRSQDGLFRWKGPALVLLRTGEAEKSQSEARRILAPKLNLEVESGARTLLLPIDTRWAVFPMMVEPRLLINKIDCFVIDGD